MVGYNQIFQKIKEVYGDKVILFNPKHSSFENTINLFQKAKVVISSHGGAMYNAMFSSHDTKIIEIIPINSRGYYPGQVPDGIPTFAHLAIYTNSQLMGQPFYRHYQVTSGSSNMNVDVDSLMKLISDAINDNP